MLILHLHKGNSIRLGNGVVIRIANDRPGHGREPYRVRLALDLPPDIQVVRSDAAVTEPPTHYNR